MEIPTMQIDTSRYNAMTIKLTADELAEVLARHLREDLGLDVPETRAFMRLCSADGQAVKKLEVEVKW